MGELVVMVDAVGVPAFPFAEDFSPPLSSSASSNISKRAFALWRTMDCRTVDLRTGTLRLFSEFGQQDQKVIPRFSEIQRPKPILLSFITFSKKQDLRSTEVLTL